VPQSRDSDGLLAGSLGAMTNDTTRGQYDILSPRATVTSRENIPPLHFDCLEKIPERFCPRLVLWRDDRAKACDRMESRMTAKKDTMRKSTTYPKPRGLDIGSSTEKAGR
jgi:hypothetical protein